MQQLKTVGDAAGAIITCISLATIILFNPIKKRIQAHREAKKLERQKAEQARAEERAEEIAFRKEIRESLARLEKDIRQVAQQTEIDDEDIGDLQYERLSQAHEFYIRQGWCPGSKKEMLCQMHKAYRARHRNHLSEHYEEDILALPDRPASI